VMSDPFGEVLDVIMGGVALLFKLLLQSLLEPILIPLFSLLNHLS